MQDITMNKMVVIGCIKGGQVEEFSIRSINMGLMCFLILHSLVPKLLAIYKIHVRLMVA